MGHRDGYPSYAHDQTMARGNFTGLTVSGWSTPERRFTPVDGVALVPGERHSELILAMIGNGCLF